MSILTKLAAAARTAASSATVYVDDIFALYSQFGSNADAAVNVGVDLSSGGLVISRMNTTGDFDRFSDSVRGPGNLLIGSSSNAQAFESAVSARSFTSTGFTCYGDATNPTIHRVFKKTPKLLDIVTYTGNATANRVISHSLGVIPGWIITKRTDSTGSWFVTVRMSNGNYSRSQSTANSFGFNSTLKADVSYNLTGSGYVTTSQVNLTQLSDAASESDNNVSGATYIMYLFAHDSDTTNGAIQCSSFTTDGSGNATVTLGYEPQLLFVKGLDDGAGAGWLEFDTARGWNASANAPKDALMKLNDTGNAETYTTDYGEPTATGFNFRGGAASVQYCFLAVRRPNKPPTAGTQVYNAVLRSGTSAAAKVTGAGFAPDTAIVKIRATGPGIFVVNDRCRGLNRLFISTAAESAYSATQDLTGFLQDGISVGTNSLTNMNSTGNTYVNYFFKRAKNAFESIVYTGTGSDHSESHNLGVTPELILTKNLSGGSPTVTDWIVGGSVLDTLAAAGVGGSGVAKWTASDAGFSNNAYFGGAATGTTMPVSTHRNYTSTRFVAHLFATVAGVTKVGSYVGNGSSQNIECGFSAGARFVMVKRIDAVGDWYIFDSARGIVSGADPYFLANNASDEASADLIDPYSGGFGVVEDGTFHINTNTGKYLFLAFA